MSTENATSVANEEEIEKDQYLVFLIGAQAFALQAMRVQEISRVMQTMAIPKAPSYVEGILNLRGQLATVINFRKKFALEPKPVDEDTRIIMVEFEGFPVGIMVDSVEEVIRIPDDKVKSLPEAAVTPISRDYITGIGMLEKKLIMILNTNELLTSAERAQAEVAKQAIRSEPAARSAS